MLAQTSGIYRQTQLRLDHLGSPDLTLFFGGTIIFKEMQVIAHSYARNTMSPVMMYRNQVRPVCAKVCPFFCRRDYGAVGAAQQKTHLL